VTRPLRDHREQEEAQLAIVKQPAATAAAAMTADMSVAMVLVTVLMTMIRGITGSGGGTAWAVSISVVSHATDIDHDISKIKIYRNLSENDLGRAVKSLQTDQNPRAASIVPWLGY
jgi:hypothetical protein